MTEIKQWVRPNTETFNRFWKQLRNQLLNKASYADCVQRLKGFFDPDIGVPTGPELRDYVNAMVQRKHAPREFNSWWRDRRSNGGAESGSAVGESVPASAPTPVTDVDGDACPADVEREELVRGWPLALVRGEKSPRIGHREAARRLGYEDAQGLLKLAERVFGAAWISQTPCLENRSGGRGRPTRDYLLTLHQLIRLAMRSDAPNADAIQEEIAVVYETWLDGRASAAPALATSDDRIGRVLEILALKDGEKERRLSEVEQRLPQLESAKHAVESTMEELIDETEALRKGAAEDRARIEAAAQEARRAIEVAEDAAARAVNAAQSGATPDRPQPLPSRWLTIEQVAEAHRLPTRGSGAKLVWNLCRRHFPSGDDLDERRIRRCYHRGAWTWGLDPLAVELLTPPLRAAREVMDREGFMAPSGRLKLDADRVSHKRPFSASHVANLMAAAADDTPAAQLPLRAIAGGKAS